MTFPIPSDDCISRFYNDCYDFRWFADHLWAKMRDARIRIEEYRPFLGERVLDYGGGFGYFAKAATEAGFYSTTFDPYLNDHCVEQTAWDAVVAIHVLEHVSNPLNVLTKVKEFLKPQGHLILAVPNFSSAGYLKLGMQWVWAQPPIAHLYHLTPAGMAALLQRAGYTVVKMSTCERWDANSYTDIQARDKYYKFELQWFSKPFAKYRWSQKLIALRNSLLRFWALRHACADDGANMTLSELYVIAKITKKE
ncbi:class I SAM-dependent methyltransferase [Geotalea toluenoxydans]|uniref:class I SAM-dependent methyltransferase n=1 Tax=Geotalea toluenoxydans TaxID=421624 RepID=UPI001FB4BEF2|nr:class I SAM-dependent methyltransferase [Geotalea toluenoxydans]